MAPLQLAETVAFILLGFAALTGLLLMLGMADSYPDPFDYDERFSVHWSEDWGEDEDELDWRENQR